MKKIVTIGLVCGLLLTGCGSNSTANAPKLLEPVGVDMDTAVVKKMSLSNTNTYEAQIIPTIVDASFAASGNIGEMKVSVGDKVKKGQILATLQGESQKSQKKNLQKALNTTIRGYKDANQLKQYDIDAMEEEYRQLETTLKKAKTGKEKKQIKGQLIAKEYDIKLEKLKFKQEKQIQQLDINSQKKAISELSSESSSTNLKSPITGEVVSTAGGSGYMVQGGSAAVCVANMSKPRLKTDYISQSILNQSSHCYAVVNGKRYEVEAEEVEINTEAIESGEGLPTETNFDFKDKNLSIEVGTFATIELDSAASADSLVIPVNSLENDDNGKYVYKIVDGNKVKTSVTVGTTTAAYAQIETGLKEGDVVYVKN